MLIHRWKPDEILEYIEAKYQSAARKEVKRALDKLKRNKGKIVIREGRAVYDR